MKDIVVTAWSEIYFWLMKWPSCRGRHSLKKYLRAYYELAADITVNKTKRFTVLKGVG